MDAINGFFKGIQDWIITEGENPIFWLIMFFGGIAIFLLAYNALHKNQ